MEFEYQALANTSKDMGTILLLNIINMKVFIGRPCAPSTVQAWAGVDTMGAQAGGDPKSPHGRSPCPG